MKNLIIERLKYHIAESVFSKISELLRNILQNEFKIKIFALDYCVSKSHLRKTIIFADEKTHNLTLEEICKEKLQIKKIVEIVTEKSNYKIDRKKAEKLLKKISLEKGRLLLHEKYLYWFPDYLEINYKSLNIIMNEKGYLSVPCRYYIAIMVFIIIN